MSFSRRDFLRAAAIAPASSPLLRWIPSGPDRSLVVVELVGGNDGLNTLIPVDDDKYHNARPSLKSVAKGALKVADGFALHPSMPQIQDLFVRGEAAAVHSVGYPKPDRSHFRSQDIWHSADPLIEKKHAGTTGWLGRAADQLAKAHDAQVPALGLGGLEVPLALQGVNAVAPVLNRIEDYSLLVAGGGKSDSIAGLVEDADAKGDLTEFVRGVAQSGVAHATKMQKALAGYRAKAEYPNSSFGRAMKLTARVLLSGFGTRICHVPLSGFDTHARQAPTHAGLMRQLSLGVGALCEDLRAHGKGEQVVVFVHSEFGRRVSENKSQGTDHGAAAPVFVFGGGVKGGLHGPAPDLGDLDDGDVKATADFRGVYAALLGRLGVDAGAVLGKPSWDAVELF